ncbi:OB-fold nucleic acid binding domain-containing protein [Nanoarchaeota archaeon]
MIKIPYDELISKIEESGSLSKKDIEEKIEQKMSQLSGLISKEGAAHIVANELGIKIVKPELITGKLKIKDILTGLRNVETAGKITQKFELREFQTDTRKGKVANFLMGDETGMIRVVLWNDKAELINSIEVDNIIKIKNAYVRENNGKKELHLGDKSELIVNPEGETIGEVKKFDPAKRKQIKELTEEDQNIELVASVVQVFDPRFYEVCPKCGKRLKQVEGVWHCDKDGNQEPGYSFVVNTVIDDGSDNLRATFFRNQTLRLFNMTEQEILLNKDVDNAFQGKKDELLGHLIKVVGRTSKNEMFDRLEFIPQLVFIDVNPDEEIQRLNDEIEKMEKE